MPITTNDKDRKDVRKKKIPARFGTGMREYRTVANTSTLCGTRPRLAEKGLVLRRIYVQTKMRYVTAGLTEV